MRPHHAVLPVIVAEDRETSSLPEFGHFLQRVVIDVLGDDDTWRVRRAHSVVPVHAAQSPAVVLRREVMTSVT